MNMLPDNPFKLLFTSGSGAKRHPLTRIFNCLGYKLVILLLKAAEVLVDLTMHWELIGVGLCLRAWATETRLLSCL